MTTATSLDLDVELIRLCSFSGRNAVKSSSRNCCCPLKQLQNLSQKRSHVMAVYLTVSEWCNSNNCATIFSHNQRTILESSVVHVLLFAVDFDK